MERVHDPRPLTPPEYHHLAKCPRSDDYRPTCECGDLQELHNENGVWYCEVFLCKCPKFVLEKDRCICEDE